MKRLNYFWPIVLITVVALLGGCTQSKERGIAMAQDFVKAWSGDSAALAKQVESIKAAVDSLTVKTPFVDAFIAEAGKADSTMALAAKVLLNDGKDVAGELCDHIIDGLAGGTLNYTQANAKVMELAQVCTRLNKEDLNATFGELLDSKAAGLSLEKQMKVYSSATIPEKLGLALKADAQSPNADKALIEQQLSALKSIYNAEDYKKFIDAYKND